MNQGDLNNEKPPQYGRDSELDSPNPVDDDKSENQSKGFSSDDVDVELPVAEIAAPELSPNNPYRDSESDQNPSPLRSQFVQPANVGAIQFSKELQNMSAQGGAVGSIILGLWSMICALITYYSFINAILAMVLGLYGLNSSKRSMALMGIIMGFIGLFMSLMEINELLGRFWEEQQSNQFE